MNLRNVSLSDEEIVFAKPEFNSFRNFDLKSKKVNQTCLSDTSVQTILKKLDDQITYTIKSKSECECESLSRLFMTLLKINIPGEPIHIPPQKVKRFQSNSFHGIQSKDIEVDLGSSIRIFLRENGDKFDVVFLGNPDYH